jgi:acyl-CoA synthetase (AMP-forming)/AMP-acid ligase II
VTSNANVVLRLQENARRAPEKVALFYPAASDAAGACVYAHASYRDIDEESDAYARGFRELGIGVGAKTILMVRPSRALFSITFALFKVGAGPVIVDPGMGVKRMLHCYRAVGAEAFIGIPVAHVVRHLFPAAFRSIGATVNVGRRIPGLGPTLDEVATRGRALGASATPSIAHASKDDLLVINFTTGSTGPARGVEYTHETAEAMVRQIETRFGNGPSDVSLATLPLFALFDLLIGSTAVLPPMDATKPASVDPVAMIDAIRRHDVTAMFASPAFLDRVGRYARANGEVLPSLRAVVAGGAPVSADVVATFRAALSPRAELHTTYGATEALPMASIESADTLGETAAGTRAGLGTCVGRPSDGLDVRIIRITDVAHPRWSDALAVSPGGIGEITVHGAIVSPRYHAAPEASALAKIDDGERTWHRTGDLGRIDDLGRLWFMGRKTQRVTTPRGELFTVQCEGVFNGHPDVRRTALVGVGEPGARRPVLCVELRAPSDDTARLERELRALAETSALTREVDTFLVHPSFPVDIRHNAKIGREELAVWATRRLGEGQERPTAWMLVPVVGWLFVAYGLLHPFTSMPLRALWLVDVFLSVVVHSAQLLLAVPLARRAGYTTTRAVFATLLFGATWWRPLR